MELRMQTRGSLSAASGGCVWDRRRSKPCGLPDAAQDLYKSGFGIMMHAIGAGSW